MRDIIFRSKNKLYVLTLKISEEYAYIQTVSENEMQYTKREIRNAKNAKVLMKKLRYPSIADLTQ